MAVAHTPLSRQQSRDSEVNLFVKYILFALNVLFWVSFFYYNILIR